MTAAPSVLLVEDEENIAYVVALALRHSGLEVRVVSTGTEALRLSSSNPIPDIMMLDVMLPDLDGFEVCRRMRADQNDRPTAEGVHHPLGGLDESLSALMNDLHSRDLRSLVPLHRVLVQPRSRRARWNRFGRDCATGRQ
jgi:PleD family two-component response regulator